MEQSTERIGTKDMPRTPEDPTPEKVYLAMNAGEPYTVAELTEEFDDASRWTIQRRLDKLVEDDFLKKKQHSEKRVSYWKPADQP